MWPMPAAAQLPLQGPRASALFGYAEAGPLHPNAALEPRDSLRQQVPATHWKEGAMLGGALGAIGGAVLVHRLCGLARESTETCAGSTVLGGVIGAALLAIPGALIGAQVSRQPPERERTD